MSSDWLWLLDPCSFLIIITASGTILWGSYRAIHIPDFFRDPIAEVDANSMKTRTAIIMPIIGSIFLLLLFYFLNWLFYLLLALMCFSALFALVYINYPWIEHLLLKYHRNNSYQFRFIGEVNTAALISFGIALVCVITWIVWPFWLLTDVLAVSIAVCVLSFLRVPNLKIATILLSIFLVYDIFWVFISPFIFQRNVMVTVATGLPTLPMVIIMPRFFSDGVSMLGNGDIVLPGLLLSYLYRFDHAKRTSFRDGYFLRTWIAYACGMFFTFIMLLAMRRAQPALTWLVPATLGTTYFFAWKRGEVKELLAGIKARVEDDDIEQNSGTELRNPSTNDSPSSGLLTSNNED